MPEFAIQIAGLAIKSPPLPPPPHPKQARLLFANIYPRLSRGLPVVESSGGLQAVEDDPTSYTKCRLLACYRQIGGF